ncbi:AlbA family DNA-binding domain-containing protein [Plantactinospora sp. CA-290183]|uniref:AlbA family DNA-binding domain-containing protein n=1 Tax=Plantactinospora sp. CA-290183 TaxID=3240006 RepID=UPI003D8EA769
MTIRLPAVEARLGCRLDQVDEVAVGRLIGLRETDDLDFKSLLYKPGAEGTSSLSGDVAAMANSGGGVVVLGIEDDRDAQAIRLTPVAMSDGEERRMRELIASHVFPFPAWDIIPVRLAAGRTHGYYILAVAASDLRPHAAKRGHGFAYPVRDGAKTRYLSEHEVADAYRNRFRLIESRIERLDDLGSMIADPSNPWHSAPWLTCTLVPTVGTRLRVSQNLIRDVKDWTRYLFDELPPFTPLREVTLGVGTGLRCLLLTSTETAPVRGEVRPIAQAVLGLDGSAAVSVNILVGERAENVVGEDDLFSQVVAGVQFVAGYAAKVAGATHDALLRVDLWTPPGLPAANAVDRSVRLGSWSHNDLRQIPGTRRARGLIRSEHTIDLDAAASSTGSAVAAAVLPYGDLVNSFGLPEPAVVSADGALQIKGWQADGQHQLREWAFSRGVPAEG